MKHFIVLLAFQTLSESAPNRDLVSFKSYLVSLCLGLTTCHTPYLGLHKHFASRTDLDVHEPSTPYLLMSAYGIPLGRLYGPAWLNGELWSPQYKCVWTAEKDQSNHHCPDQECDGDIKTCCYEKLHVAFCVCLVTMSNGHQRFCGQRFQCESPKTCALHGWGENDENRVFQCAKKGLDFRLPEVIPHEQPGWEMTLSGCGVIRQPVNIRMGLVDGELCFVRVLSYLVNGQPNQVSEIARVKVKELLLTEMDPRPAFKTRKKVMEKTSAKRALQALMEAEQDDDEYNDPCTWRRYTTFALEPAAAEKLEEKRAREARAAVLAKKRAAAARGGRCCAQQSLKTYKQSLKSRKR